MATRPILFNAEMVKAILDGQKTQTRRLVRPQPVFNEGESGVPVRCDDDSFVFQIMPYECIYEQGRIPPCLSGDILWVRETWSTHYDGIHDDLQFCYRADNIDLKSECLPGENNRWYPSIHMPKEAARIFLLVKDVRIERLQDCGDGWCLDIENEGVKAPQAPILYTSDEKFHDALRAEMKRLWDSTIKPVNVPQYGWEANPWVWVIEFERCEKPEDWRNNQ